MDISSSIIYFSLFLSLYFEVFLLITFFEPKKKLGTLSTKSNLALESLSYPSATIVVPCWNEEKTVAGTIQSLLDMRYPTDKLKVVVVDDGSTDNTYAKISEFADNSQVTIIKKENGGKHTAMNIALEACNTELIGCLDADSFVSEDSLMHAAQMFNKAHVSAVTPGMRVHNPKNALQYMQKAEYILSIFMRKSFALMGSIFVTPGPFSIFRTEAVRTVGKWEHAHGTEDLEMGLRMQHAGMIIENEPKAAVLTTTPHSVAGLYKQRVRWTHGFLRNLWDYRTMLLSRKHGNLGLLVLPFGILSILSALGIFGLFLYKTVHYLTDKIVTLIDTGFAFNAIDFSVFYISTTTLTFLTIAILVLTLVLIQLGKNLVTEKEYMGKDILAYFAIYGFVAPLWLTGATAKAITGLNVKWR
mgnify:CR=1 FL=1